MLLTDQASLLDGLSLAAFAFDQDGLATAESDIGQGSADDAAVAPPGLVDDEALDRRCRIAGPVVGLEHAPSATGCSSVPSAAARPHAAPPMLQCHAPPATLHSRPENPSRVKKPDATVNNPSRYRETWPC